MRHFLILLVVLFLRGTHSQSCDNAPLLGCDLVSDGPVPCNNGAGICKDCCRSEDGEVQTDSDDCTGECKCCVPGVSPGGQNPVCDPVCEPGIDRTEITVDPSTGRKQCRCVPCPQPFCICSDGLTPVVQIPEDGGCPTGCGCIECPEIGCPSCESNEELKYGTDARGCRTCSCELKCPALGCPRCESYEELEYGTDARGCTTCSCRCIDGSSWNEDCNTCVCSGGNAVCTLRACLPECPQIQCPLCENNEKQVSTTDIFGCPICICEQCPQVNCPRFCPPNQQLIYGDDRDGCATCTCGPCPASDCGCGPNEDEVEVVLTNGCKSCRCVPKLDRVCPAVQCPPCNGGQRKLYGVEDGCPFCICGGTCTEGATWNQECNTCRCVNGIAACTLKLCPPPVPCPIAVCPRCLQGETPVYEEDPITGCVTCSCTQGRCIEGQFKLADDGCNICTCVNGVYGCTRVACSPIECPAVGCPRCESNEELVYGTDARGCPTCSCELKCPEIGCPRCESYEELVYGTDARGCSTCSCQCTEGSTWKDDCNTCYCSGGRALCTIIECPVEPACPKPLCGCRPGLEMIDTVEEDGCPGCACVEPACPEVKCVCPPEHVIVDIVEDGCQQCVCVPISRPSTQPEACPGGICKSRCDFEAGEYIGAFDTCSAKQGVKQYCCNSPGTNPCLENGKSCDGGADCTCRNEECIQGEYEDGLCPTQFQDVPQCTRCRKCPEDNPACLFGCQGNRILKTERGTNGSIGFECVCPPLDDCSETCTRSLDDSTGCFKCDC